MLNWLRNLCYRNFTNFQGSLYIIFSHCNPPFKYLTLNLSAVQAYDVVDLYAVEYWKTPLEDRLR